MNDPELMKVGHTRHDLRELKVINDENKTGGKQRAGSPIEGGLPLGGIL